MDVIKVERRSEQAKANHLRRSGLVPCCIYGGNLKESVSIQMDLQAANRLYRTKREGSKVGLDLDGHVILTQIKEKKKRLSGDAEHFSFQVLAADKKVNSVAHIFLKNTELVPGNLEQMLFEVPLSSFPAEGLSVGTVLAVKDIPEFQSEQIDLQINSDSTVLRILDKKRVELSTE